MTMVIRVKKLIKTIRRIRKKIKQNKNLSMYN